MWNRSGMLLRVHLIETNELLIVCRLLTCPDDGEFCDKMMKILSLIAL